MGNYITYPTEPPTSTRMREYRLFSANYLIVGQPYVIRCLVDNATHEILLSMADKALETFNPTTIYVHGNEIDMLFIPNINLNQQPLYGGDPQKIVSNVTSRLTYYFMLELLKDSMDNIKPLKGNLTEPPKIDVCTFSLPTDEEVHNFLMLKFHNHLEMAKDATEDCDKYGTIVKRRRKVLSKTADKEWKEDPENVVYERPGEPYHLSMDLRTHSKLLFFISLPVFATS